MANIGNSTNRNISNSDDFALRLSTTTFMSFTCILAAVGNLLTIVAFLIDKRCRTPFNIYLLNLACTDLLITTLDAPFTIASNYMSKWIFGFKTCSFYLYVDWILFAGAYFGVMLITLDRLVALFFPVYFRQRHSVRNSSLVCLIMWIVVHLSTCPYIIIDRMSASDDEACFVDGTKQPVYGITLLVLTDWLPMGVICVGYLMIWWGMRRYRSVRLTGSAPGSAVSRTTQQVTPTAVAPRSRVVSQSRPSTVESGSSSSTQPKVLLQRSERKLYVTVCGLTLCIVLGWGPAMIYYMLTTATDGLDNAATLSSVLCLNYVVCLINPIVYDYNVPEIRLAVTRIFRRSGSH